MTDIAIVKGSTYRDVLRWATADCMFVQATLVPGAPVRLSATVRISLLEKSGRKARLRIQCPVGADIKRAAK